MALFNKKNNKNQQVEPTDANVHTPETDTVDEYDQSRADNHSYKAAMGISVASIISALALSVYFFASDIPDTIASAKAEPVVAEQPIDNGRPGDVSQPSGDGTNTDNSEGVIGNGGVVTPGMIDSIDQAEMVIYLESMDEEAYDAFTESLADAINVNDPEAIAEELIPALEAALAGDDDDGEVSRMSDDSDTSESVAESVTIEDATDEAEALFSIDGSQRLSLIDELNAVDFKYYIAEQGDTLIDLSEAFDISLGQLVEMNGINDADEIGAGALIILPSETVVPEDEKITDK